MIEIDGSFGEGGGQVLRISLAMSVITRKPCHIFNIRKKRKKPGLRISHLRTVEALTLLCRAQTKGDYLNSQEIEFYPNPISKEQISINIPTAGSITLILQALVLAGAYSKLPIRLIFNGGATDTFFSPTIDYFNYVFSNTLKKTGLQFKIDIKKRGFYPEGNAQVITQIFPSKFKQISLTERGRLKKILIISGASKNLEKRKVAERQVSGVKQILGKLNLPLEEKIEYYSSLSMGSQINIIAQLENTILGVDNLGKLGKSAEIVGEETAREFLKEVKSGACLDKHMADQILPYMALAPGKSRATVSEITKHCETNIQTIESFIDGKFEIKDNLITWNPG